MLGVTQPLEGLLDSSSDLWLIIVVIFLVLAFELFTTSGRFEVNLGTGKTDADPIVAVGQLLVVAVAAAAAVTEAPVELGEVDQSEITF